MMQLSRLLLIKDQEMEGQSKQFWSKQRTKKKLCLLSSLTLLQLFLLLFTFANCNNSCHRSWQFPHPCLSSGSLYCCNMYSQFKECSDLSVCRLENQRCLWLIIGCVMAGLLLIVGLIDFFMFSYKMLISQSPQDQKQRQSSVRSVADRKDIRQSLITEQ